MTGSAYGRPAPKFQASYGPRSSDTSVPPPSLLSSVMAAPPLAGKLELSLGLPPQPFELVARAHAEGAERADAGRVGVGLEGVQREVGVARLITVGADLDSGTASGEHELPDRASESCAGPGVD